jgi:DNA-binding HxlR family transcriptional regulator
MQILKTNQDGCVAEPLIEFLARKWLSHIVWMLGETGSMRFGALRRALRGVSARTLSARLKELEEAGFVARRSVEGAALNVSYSLTDAGRALHARMRGIEGLAAGFVVPSPSRAIDGRP